jgi:hypothetical protein
MGEFYGLLLYAIIQSQFPFPPQYAQAGTLVCVAFVLVAVIKGVVAARQSQTRDVFIWALGVVPLATLVGLNVLHLYPIDPDKLTAFLTPSVILLLGLGLVTVEEWVADRIAWLRTVDWRLFEHGVVVACLAVAFVVGIKAAWWQPSQDEDSQGAIAYLKSAAGTDDLVYVHASMSEQATLYGRVLEWSHALTRYGRTGYPCCPRGINMELVNKDADWFAADWEDALRRAKNGRIWLLYTERHAHWAWLGRDEERDQTDILRRIGCALDRPATFVNVGLFLASCPSPLTSLR